MHIKWMWVSCRVKYSAWNHQRLVSRQVVTDEFLFCSFLHSPNEIRFSPCILYVDFVCSKYYSHMSQSVLDNSISFVFHITIAVMIFMYAAKPNWSVTLSICLKAWCSTSITSSPLSFFFHIIFFIFYRKAKIRIKLIITHSFHHPNVEEDMNNCVPTPTTNCTTSS